MKHIIILGRSKKFFTAIKSLFPKAQITIIPWRQLQNFKDFFQGKKVPSVDLILIAGYDFNSYWSSYSHYIKVNIERPLNTIEHLAKSNPLILYINTTNEHNKKTYSRYRFAKTELAIRLQKRFENIKIIAAPLLVDVNKKPDVHGGILDRIIFNILVRFELISYVTPSDLMAIIRETFKTKKRFSLIKLTPYALSIRRSQFVDRCLRLILG
jgi:hypothetical protein